MIPTTRELPFHDYATPLRELEAQRRARQLRCIDATATFCCGMVLGALIVAGLFLLASFSHR